MDVNVHAQSGSPLKRTRLVEPTLVGFRQLARCVHARAMMGSEDTFWRGAHPLCKGVIGVDGGVGQNIFRMDVNVHAQSGSPLKRTRLADFSRLKPFSTVGLPPCEDGVQKCVLAWSASRLQRKGEPLKEMIEEVRRFLYNLNILSYNPRPMKKKYHIWTAGCQMNVADSRRLGSSLEKLGYEFTAQVKESDVLVLNTCVVRQSAENKALGFLHSIRPLKEKNPDLVINLMGCLVGVRGTEKLQKKLPFVDVFSPPSDPGPLIAYLSQDADYIAETNATQNRFAIMDGEILIPEHERGKLISAFIPIVYGCSHACTYCIIPYQRGIERSRPVEDIIAEAHSLAEQGVKEITLLGQIVDRYGKDIDGGENLASLLHILNDIDGVERIRFLTSHPNYFETDIMDAVAKLDKVMPHFEVPIQAGDDKVLADMKRGYTQENYRQLIAEIRARVPNCSIATDIIVGFPGETEEEFEHTYQLIADLKMDVAHLARYSPRKGTVSKRRMKDDVTDVEKRRRFHRLESLQKGIATEINAKYLGEKVEVLFEEKVKGRWRGRTPTNKLVFVETDDDLRGKIISVRITWTGPWSMQANLLNQTIKPLISMEK